MSVSHWQSWVKSQVFLPPLTSLVVCCPDPSCPVSSRHFPSSAAASCYPRWGGVWQPGAGLLWEPATLGPDPRADPAGLRRAHRQHQEGVRPYRSAGPGQHHLREHGEGPRRRGGRVHRWAHVCWWRAPFHVTFVVSRRSKDISQRQVKPTGIFIMRPVSNADLMLFQSQELSWGLRFLNKASNVFRHILWHRPKKYKNMHKQNPVFDWSHQTKSIAEQIHQSSSPGGKQTSRF